MTKRRLINPGRIKSLNFKKEIIMESSMTNTENYWQNLIIEEFFSINLDEPEKIQTPVAEQPVAAQMIDIPPPVKSTEILDEGNYAIPYEDSDDEIIGALNFDD